jgi:hypothetical protein
VQNDETKILKGQEYRHNDPAVSNLKFVILCLNWNVTAYMSFDYCYLWEVGKKDSSQFLKTVIVH